MERWSIGKEGERKDEYRLSGQGKYTEKQPQQGDIGNQNQPQGEKKSRETKSNLN